MKDLFEELGVDPLEVYKKVEAYKKIRELPDHCSLDYDLWRVFDVNPANKPALLLMAVGLRSLHTEMEQIIKDKGGS